jgi:hypothetical protein
MGSKNSKIKSVINKEDYYPIVDKNCTTQTEKSLCLIINNWDFKELTRKQKGLPKGHKQEGENDLPGYIGDVNRLSKNFESFGFHIEKIKENVNGVEVEKIAENKTAEQMRNIIAHTSKKLNSKQKAFVCVLLSHGDNVAATIMDENKRKIELDGETQIFGVDGKSLLVIRDIVSLFNNEKCKNFLNIPKLFFILSCRGGESNSNFEVNLIFLKYTYFPRPR